MIMKYTELQKLAYKKSWDPNYEDFNNTEFAFDTAKVDETLYAELKKHYSKLLAKAYYKSTGKHLADPASKIDPRYSYALGRAANVDPAVLKQLSPYYYQRLGGWSNKIYNVSPELIADAVDYVNERRYWYPLEKQPGDTDKVVHTKKIPDNADLDLALVNKKASEELEDGAGEPDDIDWDEIARQVKEYRSQNELGAWGAFKKSLPVSLLIAGLSGVTTGLASGSVGLGAVVGGLSGAATSGLNIMNNRHALPEEAGTSFFAMI